jgi:hypothetical protein
MAILGEISILGTNLFLEEKVYFWSVCLRRQERSMQRKKQKQHARGKTTWPHADMPNHVRVRVFGNIVMAISQ